MRADEKEYTTVRALMQLRAGRPRCALGGLRAMEQVLIRDAALPPDAILGQPRAVDAHLVEAEAADLASQFKA